MIRAGEPWGEPYSGAVDVEVRGGDADLAALLPDRRGALVRFLPGPASDLARAVGASEAPTATGVAVPIDAIAVEPGGFAVNGLVIGTPPARLRATTPSANVRVVVDGRELAAGPATTVVVANGQFFDGLDVVPRGHPGDGRLEIQVYALRRGERAALRRRLPAGVHLPHPRVATASGRAVEVHVDRGRLPLGIDGTARGGVTDLTATVVPGALRLAL
ncbi:MAG TPA: hypothetical protein VGN59_14300 [Acidimicrobiia bacterium]